MPSSVNRRTFTLASLLATAGAANTVPDLAAALEDASTPEAGDPAEAAVALSHLEVEGIIANLYFDMHPDAKAVVPLYAVAFWYRTDFLPRGPEVIEVTGVAYVDWTWEVTGVTYPGTAEVAYTQGFADGSTVEDTLRLVQSDGEWRWFFGRSREFVEEQIRLAKAEIYPSETSPAPDWAEAALANGADGLGGLPETYPGEEPATLGPGDDGDEGESRKYKTRDGFTPATVEVVDRSPTDTDARTWVQGRIDAQSQGQEFEVLSWSLTPTATIAHATIKTLSIDVIPNQYFAFVASDDPRRGIAIKAWAEDALAALGEALAR